MREILFRGKRLADGSWAEGYFVKTETDGFIFTGRYALRDGGPIPAFERFEVDPETVGQFTGLRDKNEDKIFEGDIIRYCNENFYIKYVEGFASFTAREGRNMSYAPSLTPITAERIEVVGNIHDNPELLQAREDEKQE